MLVLLVGGFMNYAPEMRSHVMIYIQGFIQIDSGVQKLKGEIHIRLQTHTHTQRNVILYPCFYCFIKRKVV
jgi:hypothetical protein